MSLPTSTTSSPPSSGLSSRRSSRAGSKSPLSLTLDLTNLPPLIQPSPPSNTLIITELLDISLFHPASLATIRQHISSIAPLNSFSPLKSFRRIVCSFYDIDGAIRVRTHLDGTTLLQQTAQDSSSMNVRTRVYFGEPTPLIDPNATGTGIKHLEAPHSNKLFFISPPPSPPHGWEMRNEDPPNKQVHAADLAEALRKLRTANKTAAEEEMISPVSPTATAQPFTATNAPLQRTASTERTSRHRSRSSTIIYHPQAHGSNPHLPAVMVEDTSADEEQDEDNEMLDVEGDVEMGMDGSGKKMMCHTARPPVELMSDA